MSSDNRRSLRAPVNIWVRNVAKNEVRLWLDEETLTSDFSFCYTTQDISAGGLFLESDTPLDVNSELQLEITLPGEPPFRVAAKVRWVRDTEDAVNAALKPGMGLEFVNLAEPAQTAIQRFLQGPPA